MTRGVTGFNSEALRAARLAARCEEHAHGMTAACLARRVGTSKSLILSYEHGRSSPSPQRLAQLAAAVGVPAASLMAGETQLSDLRVASGLTVNDLAARLGIAVNTYRRIEREGVVPKRRPGVMWDLCDVLGVGYTKLRTALDRIPTVQQRWQAAATVLCSVTEQAVSPGPFTPIEDTSAEARLLGILFKARTAVVSQLVNIHLGHLRQLASQLAQAKVRLDFATNTRWNSHYEADVLSLGHEIEQAREHGPELLEQYLVRPMPLQCWQTLALLYLTGPGGLDPSQMNAVTVATLERSFDYYLVERSLTGISLSTPGVLFFTDTLPYYRAIYPVQGVIRPDSQHYGWPSVAPRSVPPRRRLRTAHVLGHDPHFYWNDIPRRHAERR
ncbi:helix-turn-helix domain-containing protein [Streptomyces hirsutus]|uniref:helix-turn-helix domain-containing protein n=1 Tax=Streptomyces hirsutus TaxID=35620 RepID=UPI0033ABC469